MRLVDIWYLIFFPLWLRMCKLSLSMLASRLLIIDLIWYLDFLPSSLERRIFYSFLFFLGFLLCQENDIPPCRSLCPSQSSLPQFLKLVFLATVHCRFYFQWNLCRPTTQNPWAWTWKLPDFSSASLASSSIHFMYV